MRAKPASIIHGSHRGNFFFDTPFRFHCASTEVRTCIHDIWGSLELSWAAFGLSLSLSCAVLDLLWAIFGCLGPVLRPLMPFFGCLGHLLGCLGPSSAILAASLAQDGSKMPPRGLNMTSRRPKINQDDARWSQDGQKMAQDDPRWLPKAASGCFGKITKCPPPPSRARAAHLLQSTFSTTHARTHLAWAIAFNRAF